MNYIKLQSIVNYQNMNQLIKELDSNAIYRNQKIKFDFCDIKYFPTFALVLFILACHQLKTSHNCNFHVRLSNTNKLNNCIFILARIGLFDALPENTSFYPYKPQQYKKRKNPAILEITKVNNDSSISQLIELSRAALEINTSYYGTQILDICKMMSEIIQNIQEHSSLNAPGLILIQNYPNKKYMQLVIADNGVGIPNTIKSKNQYIELSDAQCIKKSLEYGVTRHTKEERRGEGLAECIKLADKYNANIFIRSNTGCFTYDIFNPILEDNIGMLKGTQFDIKFPTKNNP